MIADTLMFLAGLILAGLTLRDVFQTVIVPGEARSSLQIANRLLHLLLPVWKLGRGKRSGLSGTFAPAVLVNSFIIWMILLLAGYGLMAWALHDEFKPPLTSLFEAFYVVGSSLVTVGLSEENPIGAARWIILAAGFSGFAVVTMAVTYLLQVQSSVSARDTGIIKLNTVAGEPPSALTMLERFAAIGNRDELPGALREGRNWCASVRQTHVTHPTLIYFQSVGSQAGWPAALGALLDLSLMLEFFVADERLSGPAALLRFEGVSMARQLAASADLEPKEVEPDKPELVQAYQRLSQSSYELCPDPDFGDVARHRAEYRAYVDALADHLGKPTTPLVRQA